MMKGEIGFGPNGKGRTMIELLVLIIIATIGVFFTSTTGEAESNKMAQKTAKDALREAEGQHGIGILGIDVVARKARAMWSRDDDDQEDHAIPADALATNLDDEDEEREEMPDAIAQAFDQVGAAQDDFDDFDAHLTARVQDRVRAYEEDNASAPVTATVAEDEWDDDEDDWDDDGFAQAGLSDLVGDDLSSRAQDDTTKAAYDEWHEDARQDAHGRAAAASRRSGRAAADKPVIDTANAPVVEDFDPGEEQLVIGYRPGEAGNGRIGIVPDPLREGAAAVTLGGRCVAVVLNGLGTLKAHHVDLVCEDDGDMAA
jgi:hypothetical protein